MIVGRASDITFNVWLKPVSNKDRREIIAYYKSLPNQLTIVTDEHYKAELLKIEIDNGYKLRYRTAYNEAYIDGDVIEISGFNAVKPCEKATINTKSVDMHSVIDEFKKHWDKDRYEFYDAAFNGIFGAALNGNNKTNKEENETMCERNYDEKYLVSNYHDRELDNLIREKREVEDMIRAEAEIKKVAKPFFDFINMDKETGEVKPYKLENMLRMFTEDQYLTKVEQKQLEAIDKQFYDLRDSLDNYCREVVALLSMADTYEQKRQILKDYEIVKDITQICEEVENRMLNDKDFENECGELVKKIKQDYDNGKKTKKKTKKGE